MYYGIRGGVAAVINLESVWGRVVKECETLS